MDQEYPTVDEERQEDEAARSRHKVLCYHSLQSGRERGEEGEGRGGEGDSKWCGVAA